MLSSAPGVCSSRSSSPSSPQFAGPLRFKENTKWCPTTTSVSLSLLRSLSQVQHRIWVTVIPQGKMTSLFAVCTFESWMLYQTKTGQWKESSVNYHLNQTSGQQTGYTYKHIHTLLATYLLNFKSERHHVFISLCSRTAEVDVRAGNKLRQQTDVMRGVWGESDLLEEQQLRQRRRILERLRQSGGMMGEWGW